MPVTLIDPATYYVAPGATSTAGTLDSPCSLAFALQQQHAGPGDTIYMESNGVPYTVADLAAAYAGGGSITRSGLPVDPPTIETVAGRNGAR